MTKLELELTEQVKFLTEQITTLFGVTAHGDLEHRLWLKKKIADHFNMQPKDMK